MITTFLFDLGGVLFTNGTNKFITSLSNQYKIPEEEIKEVIDGKIGSDYRENKINRNQFWRLVISQLNLKETSDVLEKQWIDGYEIILGTKTIIENLSKKYRLYYLSDNVKERVDALDKKYGFKKLFIDGIFSHEVGVRKPNIKIYEFALKKANSRSGETVFIDDKQHFLEPAKMMGIKTIFFTSPEKLQTDLFKEKLI